MKLFRKMFAEKILRFHEGTNRLIRIMMNLPLIGSHVSENIYDKKNVKARTAIGIVAQLVGMIIEFVKKFIYILVFMYIPYRLIAIYHPLIASNQEKTMIFMFAILTILCGSLANNTMLALGDRDYLMIRVVLISPYMNFLGRLIYKMATDFIYYTILLCIFKVSFANSLLLGLITICARPIGEMFAIISFESIKSLYDNRNTYNGIIMALCIMFAYGVPILNKKIVSGWMFVVSPVFVIIMLICGAGAMYYLWWYKYYRKIMREAMRIKREE